MIFKQKGNLGPHPSSPSSISGCLLSRHMVALRFSLVAGWYQAFRSGQWIGMEMTCINSGPELFASV